MVGWKLFFAGSFSVMAVVYPLFVGRALRQRPVLRAGVKFAGSLIAVLLASLGAAHTPTPVSWPMAAGLFVCAVADIVIGRSFFAGAAVFLLGHLCFLLSFLAMAPFRLLSLLPLALIAPAMLAMHSRAIKKSGKAAPFYIFYGAVILFTLSTALLLPSRAGAAGFCAAAGMLLFVASDCLIATRVYAHMPFRRDCLIMGLYYAALLTLSLVSLRPWHW